MTIGPEPMTSTDFRSSRLGTPAPLRGRHQLAEPAELAARVVRARRRLRVVLHAERGHVEQAQALDHTVVDVDMTYPGPAELGVERRERGGRQRRCPAR